MTEPVPSDEQLLAEARAGAAHALEALVERHQAQVFRFGMKMCGDPEDAKDVLQETLLAMARGIREFRGASSLSTWLYTIARSHCIKKRRRSKFAPDEEQSFDATGAESARVAAPGDAPDEELAAKQVARALEDAIAGLEPAYREVLLLRDVEGLTAPEVAEVVGASVQAVKSRLHRARLAVRERLAPLLGVAPTAAVSSGCPDVLTMFSQHLEDEISAMQCAEMERHLEGCARCRGTCETLKRTLALCRTTGTAASVPAAVQASVRTALRAFLAGSA
ncbi:MAG TPA: sigma-70 family RNA polymerase sigma factor [Polyangia bacterium]|nr:sigma-70 family RNA polymerase sigma factor [Polyangia bacterium]